MNKKNSRLYYVYATSEAATLRDAYKSYSDKKAKAEASILEEMRRLNGFSPRITSNNSFTFSMAYTYPCPDTGELRLRYHTHANVYDFPIDLDPEI